MNPKGTHQIPLDWSRSQINILVRGKKFSYRSISEMLRCLEQTNPEKKFQFFFEASFGSFSPEEKFRDVKLITDHGHTCHVFHSRITHKLRKALDESRFLPKTKDGLKYRPDPTIFDEPDLLAIEEVIKSGRPTRVLKPEDIRIIDADTPTSYFIRQRQQEYSDLDKAVSLLPPPASLPLVYQQAFCDSTGPKAKYVPSLAMTIYSALKDPRSVTSKGFQQVIGLYGNGRGSVFRATLIRRNMIRVGAKKGELRVPWRDYQRCVRYMYHEMKERASST